MKIFLETDSGRQIEVKEIQHIPEHCSILLFGHDQILSNEDLAHMEKILSEKTRKPCVILPNRFTTVWGA